jgi:hypothetical protein
MLSLRKFALSAFAASFFVGAPLTASAHGDMRRLQNACLLKIGPDFIYFTGYQPAVSQRKFCEDIPVTGDAIFALDYAQSEMRDMAVDFRILRDPRGGGEPSAASAEPANTEAYLPPKRYPNGTLSFEHVFKESGNFIGVVTANGPNGEHWVSQFPFSVGRLLSAKTPYYLMAAAAMLALLLALSGGREDGDGRRG